MRFLQTSIIVLLLLLAGCKTNQTKNKLKVGHWIYTDTVNNIAYKSTGKYRKSIEKGTWKYFENNQLAKREKYKRGSCYTTTYFPNGKVASQGKTKLVMSDYDTHWYYFGDWNFYDETGKLIRIKQYQNSELLKDSKQD